MDETPSKLTERNKSMHVKNSVPVLYKMLEANT